VAEIEAPSALTIAIPTYERRERVLALVDSVLEQLRADDELLVVDDGSRDGTAEQLRERDRLRLVEHKENLGLVRSWNDCLALASKPWICILHDDDDLQPGALDALRRACVVAGGPALIAHAPEGTSLDGGFRYEVWEPGPYSVMNATVVPSGATVHRAVVDAVGCFDERFGIGPDIEYFARVSAKFPVVTIHSPPIVRMRFHESNHQFETWRRPEFLRQLQELESQVRAYAGVPEAATAYWANERWSGHLMHMFRHSRRIGDRRLVRKSARELRERGNVGMRVRARAYIAAVLGR
jgi:glycosyltransferase involved in cell wall biosynthesis